MSRVAFKTADVTRLIKGALNAGLSLDQFRVVHTPDGLALLPAHADAPHDEAEDMDRRMRDAFGA